MPVLDSLNPSVVRAGQVLSLQGSGFAAPMVATFGGVATPASCTVTSPTLATVTVPSGLAAAGEITSALVHVTVASVESNRQVLLITVSPTAAPAPQLVSLEQVRAVLRKEATQVQDDARLAVLIGMASSQIAAELRGPVLATAATETYDGDGTALLRLNRTPIVSVAAVSINGVAQTLTELRTYPQYIRWDESDEYDPRLRAAGRVFPSGRRNISVTYTAGFAAIPQDIVTACIEQVVYLHNTLDKLGMMTQGNTQSGVTTTFSTAELCESARRRCARYRRVEVAAV